MPVMAGDRPFEERRRFARLYPAIHELLSPAKQYVDARVKPGHDDLYNVWLNYSLW